MDEAECALSHIAMRTRLPFSHDAESLHSLAAPLARLERLKLYPAGEPDIASIWRESPLALIRPIEPIDDDHETFEAPSDR